MVGASMSVFLEHFENQLIEEELSGILPGFTDEGFRAAIKIFMSAFLERTYLNMVEDGLSNKDMLLAAEEIGTHMHKFIINYTGYDTRKSYEQDEVA